MSGASGAFGEADPPGRIRVEPNHHPSSPNNMCDPSMRPATEGAVR